MGKSEDAVTEVRGVKGRSRNAIPFRIVPALGQRPENGIDPPNKECWDVFQQHEARSNCANEPSELIPETRPFIFKPELVPGVADALTGEATSEQIDAFKDPPHSLPPLPQMHGNAPHWAMPRDDFTHVREPLNPRPVFGEHRAAEWANLDLRNALHARAFKAQIQAADPGEQ